MSQVTEQSVRFQTALASIKLIQASAVLDLTEGDFDFLTSNKVWIATERSRARRCVEACVYGTLDFVGYPRFPAPVEFIAAVIAYYVHPVNIQTACLIMEGAEFTENIINGVERPVKVFFSSRRRHTVCSRDWSSDVCSSDLHWPRKPLLPSESCKAWRKKTNKTSASKNEARVTTRHSWKWCAIRRVWVRW